MVHDTAHVPNPIGVPQVSRTSEYFCITFIVLDDREYAVEYAGMHQSKLREGERKKESKPEHSETYRRTTQYNRD